MNNKLYTGNQMRFRLKTLKRRLKILEEEKIEFGKWKRFVHVVNMRIRIKKSQIKRYEKRIEHYLEIGRIE